MKIRKLKDNGWGGDSLGLGAIGQVILALGAAQNSTAPAVTDSADFQVRCSDAIIALANRLLEKVEAEYEPEEKKFDVEFDVKRSGVHHITVSAKDRDEAMSKAQNLLEEFSEDWFATKDTDFVAADVVDAKEARDGQA